jgi:TRAP-type C4-dicarboxylate transport system substrate-binding protein
MHTKTTWAAAAIVALAAGGAQAAEAPTLKFGTTAPPGTHIAKWFDAWTEEMNKVAPDVVKVKVYHNTLGNTRTMLDSVRNKVADFGWFNPGYFAGQFERFYVTTFPGVADKAEPGSVALWRMMQKGDFANEFASVHPIYLHAYPPGNLHTNYPVTSVESFKGHKFAMSSKVDGDMVQALGAAPISVGLYAFYESMQNKVVDGIVSQWTAFAPFKLQEVTKYHVDIPLGNSAAVIAFNNDSWKALSDDARKAVASHSGEKASRALGKFWDGVAEEAKVGALKLPGHQLVTLPKPEVEKFYKTIAVAYEEWKKNTPNSEALLYSWRSEYQAAAKPMTN